VSFYVPNESKKAAKDEEEKKQSPKINTKKIKIQTFEMENGKKESRESERARKCPHISTNKSSFAVV